MLHKCPNALAITLSFKESLGGVKDLFPKCDLKDLHTFVNQNLGERNYCCISEVKL